MAFRGSQKVVADRWLPNNKRDETLAERADRNFVELLQEFRVAQQGVQVLFAFLLTVPFTNRFSILSSLQQWVFLAALLSAAFGTVLFVAPVSLHRLLFRMGLKDQIVRLASRLAQVGIVLMLISMLASVYVVSSVVFNSTLALWMVIAGCMSALVFWYIMPLYIKHLVKNNNIEG